MDLDYFALSEKYRPAVIETLLVGEAPPPTGASYFYSPRRMPKIERPVREDNSLPATIFNHYFCSRPKDEQEYELFLLLLKAKGVFLIDVCDFPVKVGDRKSPNGVSPHGLALIEKEIPLLRRKMEQRKIEVADDRIIFLLPRHHYRRLIVREFPSSRAVRWVTF